MPQDKPLISIVIVAYDMAREIPRTVASFLPPYQICVSATDIEIIVVENGSPSPVAQETIAGWPANVRYMMADPVTTTPATALNQGIAAARGDYICAVIDGARMASPGLLKYTMQATGLAAEPAVATVGCHIGYKLQAVAVKEGYCQAIEDEMLAAIDWQNNGYDLFNISCFGGSAPSGWLGNLAESNAITLSRRMMAELGGFDERFDIPGGGIVNLDFFRRAVEHPDTTYMLVMGEATFHQYHGGVTTSRPVARADAETPGLSTWQRYARQYRQITGKAWAVPTVEPVMIGGFTPQGRKALQRAATEFLARQKDKTAAAST
ncbi:glycosyltransferase family 2 protein [Parvularcula flava]|uniref:Glycosyltransferase family 2 protein n=1 Tax=Aquisalinus luteolus TaxID=1566827 RepID=A0A8J3A6W1_9PROT|nr:glycosyltransferase family A protein [Aquisalinus luteolus]NHK29503.1 glycosyltransferase family 2 protein [Aquisalinus luteolus]GGI01746.1 hypothetical protein GCM10011355_33110 [Aquisalinus luteolus]